MATGNQSALSWLPQRLTTIERFMTSSEAGSPNKIPYLDGLRGYSILSVVVLHAVGSRHVPRWLIPADLLFGNDRLGVYIFFAISGFLGFGKKLQRSIVGVELVAGLVRRVASDDRDAVGRGGQIDVKPVHQMGP